MLSWIEISKSRLVHNARILKRIAKPAKVMGIIKANAYGHGMEQVAAAVASTVDWFGVVSLDEALRVRPMIKRKPLLILSFYDLSEKDKLARAIGEGVRFPLYSLNQLPVLESAAKKARKKAYLHLKIDTGTSRLGIFNRQIPEFITSVKKYPHIKLEGLFSHFADSEENLKYTSEQLNILKEAKEILGQSQNNVITHIACSAANFLHPGSRQDMIRAGIMLYGLHPSKKTRQNPKPEDYVGSGVKLLPALTWKAKVMQVKTLPKGTFVGYGLTYKTKKKTDMAVIGCGYYDGYARRLSNNSYVLVGGKKAKVLGRICMNMFMVDVSGLRVREGDVAVLLGQQGKETITASELARKIGTINYEVVSRINPALTRIIVK